jgi:hypothetical protein
MPLDIYNLLQNTIDAYPNLSNDEKQIVINIINKNPELFHNIDLELEKIIKNKTINYHDIPEIIHIIYKILNIHLDFNEVSPILIIKFVLDILLDSGILPIPAIDILLAKTIIDNSLNLLEINIPIIEKTKCCKWFC